MSAKPPRGPRPGNFYSGLGLDRADHLRRDAAWLAARISHAETLFVPVWRGRNLVDAGAEPRPLWLGAGELGALAAPGEALFLGRHGEAAYFALDLSDLDEAAAAAALGGRGDFRDLRAIGPVLARRDGALLAYARGLVHWHRRHRFCGVCGAPSESRQGGHVRTCTDPACAADHFPRTDPAVIMLIHDGAGRCVLGRQRIWPPGMHSTLAGFVEPGESLEEAVAREVHEEVGIAVDEVVYHSSQPWPFPSSIMLGFHAHGEYGPLAVNGHELAEARWYTRAELLASPEDERFRLPRRDSIARRLIEDWLAEG